MEIIIHEETGFQFDIGNENQLAEYLEQLYKNTELRMNLATNANEFVKSNFMPKVVGEKFLKIYQDFN